MNQITSVMTQIARTLITPIGVLAIVAEEGALQFVLHEKANASIITAMQAVGVPIDAPSEEGENASVLAETEKQLQEYFAGKRKEFDLHLAQSGTLFQRRIWNAMLEVPYGETISYQELARRAGHPQAVRAAGTACGANPLPVIVPCHRITRSDGSVGKFALGDEVKVKLLQHEGSKVVA
jgi:methylated-DNA-[protein]-cysteine S-methyltransferase